MNIKSGNIPGDLNEILFDWPAEEITFLCGGGISALEPTQIPTVHSFVKRCISFCTENEEIREAVNHKLKDTSSAPRFEVLVDSMRKLADKDLTIGRLFDSFNTNCIHEFLAWRCSQGAAVVTTNFDNCIERAMLQPCRRAIFEGNDLEEPPPLSRIIVKPHGSNPLHEVTSTSPLVISIEALAHTARGFLLFPVWRDYLISLFSNRIVVVIGYSGSDDFDITPIIKSAGARLIVWVDYSDDVPSPTPMSI